MSPSCTPWLARVFPSSIVLPLLLLVSLVLSSSAQSTSSAASLSTVSANVTIIAETSSITSTAFTGSGTQTLAVVTAFPTVVNVTITIAPTPTSSSSLGASATASSTASATILATKIDPAFGVLGSVLILTGLPSAFLGHKNRWSVHPLSVYRLASLRSML